MIVTCGVCGCRFDNNKTGIDWRNEKYLCFGCNDKGYDLTRDGETTKHGNVIDLVFGDKTISNAKPSTLGSEFAVSPGWAVIKFVCAWGTIITVLVGVTLWALVAVGMAGMMGMR